MNINELLGIRTNINEPKIIGSPDIYNITEKIFVTMQEYQLRNNKFIDVIFNNNGIEKFLGRFNKDENILRIKYNNGKILIYADRIKDTKIQIIKVYSLYGILDDIFYSETEEDALNIFDSRLDTSHLKNKDNLIARSDIEKKKRIKG